MSVTSVTTVGYGDVSFNTAHGRFWAIMWILGSTFTVTRIFVYFHDYHSQKRSFEILENGITSSEIKNDQSLSISKYEYVMYMLKKMGRVSETEIQKISNKFDAMPLGDDDDGNA
jgi:potassium channel subfamily K